MASAGPLVLPPRYRRLVQRRTRPCHGCGADYSCEWAIDAWTCTRARCGDEWYDEHDAVEYLDPALLDGIPALLLFLAGYWSTTTRTPTPIGVPA